MARADTKLLGGLPFVSRTFEGGFKDTPFILDMDANLYIGPADQVSRDEHSSIEVIYHFLAQTGQIHASIRTLLRDRKKLLEAFDAFDDARKEQGREEFNLRIFGTYDGEPLFPVEDDDLPAGPCGKSVNELKLKFYKICRTVDKDFEKRKLSAILRVAEARFIRRERKQ